MDNSFQIGTKFLDKLTHHEEVITNITTNSVEMTQKKITERGIDSTQWFSEKNFIDRFQIIK